MCLNKVRVQLCHLIFWRARFTSRPTFRVASTPTRHRFRGDGTVLLDESHESWGAEDAPDHVRCLVRKFGLVLKKIIMRTLKKNHTFRRVRSRRRDTCCSHSKRAQSVIGTVIHFIHGFWPLPVKTKYNIAVGIKNRDDLFLMRICFEKKVNSNRMRTVISHRVRIRGIIFIHKKKETPSKAHMKILAMTTLSLRLKIVRAKLLLRTLMIIFFYFIVEVLFRGMCNIAIGKKTFRIDAGMYRQ